MNQNDFLYNKQHRLRGWLTAVLTAALVLSGCRDSQAAETPLIEDIEITSEISEIQSSEQTTEKSITTSVEQVTSSESTEEIETLAISETKSETGSDVETVTIAGQEFSVDETDVIIKATKDGVDISNISYLENLQYLELLNIEEGYSYVTGFNGISEMEKLEELYIKGVHIKSDFENIQYCQNLKKLYLDLTPIYDISCIKNLTYLEEIYICNADISDITSLTSLKHLKKVSIIETDISDLSPLECLDNLEYIYISCNSNIDENQIEQLKKQLPNCEII